MAAWGPETFQNHPGLAAAEQLWDSASGYLEGIRRDLSLTRPVTQQLGCRGAEGQEAASPRAGTAAWSLSPAGGCRCFPRPAADGGQCRLRSGWPLPLLSPRAGPRTRPTAARPGPTVKHRKGTVTPRLVGQPPLSPSAVSQAAERPDSRPGHTAVLGALQTQGSPGPRSGPWEAGVGGGAGLSCLGQGRRLGWSGCQPLPGEQPPPRLWLGGGLWGCGRGLGASLLVKEVDTIQVQGARWRVSSSCG